MAEAQKRTELAQSQFAQRTDQAGQQQAMALIGQLEAIDREVGAGGGDTGPIRALISQLAPSAGVPTSPQVQGLGELLPQRQTSAEIQAGDVAQQKALTAVSRPQSLVDVDKARQANIEADTKAKGQPKPLKPLSAKDTQQIELWKAQTAKVQAETVPVNIKLAFRRANELLADVHLAVSMSERKAAQERADAAYKVANDMYASYKNQGNQRNTTGGSAIPSGSNIASELQADIQRGKGL